MNTRKSAIVVRVKPALLQWVRRRGLRCNYFAEEDCVWIIPSLATFADAASITSYVDSLKERMLDAELERFGAGLRLEILLVHSFDELLELELRQDVEFAPEP